MADEKNIIKKAVIEIHIPSADNAMDLQNKALVFFKEKICPMIEKIVEKYSHSGETIRIDKLELDFENFNPEYTGDDTLIKLEQQFEEKLIKLVSEEKRDNFSGEIITAVKKIPKEKADEELFLYLLKTGSLPWWAKTETPVSLEMLAQKVIAQSSTSIKENLKTALRLEAVRKRIAYKLSTDTIEKIISLISVSSPDLLKFINEILNLLKDTFSAPEKLRRSVYEYVLKYPPASSDFNKRSFISGFIKEKNDLSFVEELYRSVTSVNSSAITVIIKQGLADTNDHFSKNIKKIFTVKDVEEYLDKKGNEEQIQDKNTPVDAAGNEIVNSEYEEETGDYFIKNSGLILLAPYLPAFFKELGLYDGKEFISDETKGKAVYVLQYLVTGNEENVEEHEMVLNKVLCGLEITTPLIFPFIISEKEKEECKSLLQAVADNWSALKGTSGEGMRDAFFMRDGILEQQSNGWNLKIEKTTIDILLDKLPWGISIIQMPWSTDMIFVTW